MSRMQLSNVQPPSRRGVLDLRTFRRISEGLTDNDYYSPAASCRLAGCSAAWRLRAGIHDLYTVCDIQYLLPMRIH